jgi:hypothetical protein
MPLLLSVVVLSRRERRRKCEKLRERVGKCGKIWEPIWDFWLLEKGFD